MKRTAFFFGILGFVTTTAAAIGGCASSEADCAYGICGDGSASGDGTIPDGTIPDGGLPDVVVPGCPTPNDPLAEPAKCFSDKDDAFVSAAAPPGGTGTKASPFKTIEDGLKSKKARVVIAQGTYSEILEVRDAPVRLFGGLAPSFEAKGTETLVSSSKTVGLTISTEVGLSSISIKAANAAIDGESSIGVFVTESGRMVMDGGTVTAGTGKAGKSGENGSNYDPALLQDDPLIKGNNATSDTQGLGQVCETYCRNFVGVTVRGGRGGPGGPGMDDPGSGAPGQTGSLGGAGTYSKPPTCTNGIAGEPAPNAVGGKGASTPIKIESGKPASTAGENGVIARPGQGGGGGAGNVSANSKGGGGGGGCGGCGGGAGTGGQSGGSSIGVLLLGGGSSIKGVTIVTGVGGQGGPGGDGQAGQLGGARGEAVSGGTGCLGANGGKGGHGGGGGGGAGGHSVSVAYRGQKPSIEVTARFASGPASGGSAGTTAPDVSLATAGAPGLSQAEFGLP